MTIGTFNSELATDPPVFLMLQSEEWPLGIDVTDQLANGDTISSPVFTLYNMNTGAPVSGFTSSPSVSGNVITQAIDGPGLGLQANQSYRLTLTFTANANKKPSSQLIIRVFPAP